MNKSYDVHHELTFNLFAVPFLIALIAYIAGVLRSSDVRERSGLIIVTLLFLCALPIPVWCGGNSWHFFTAAMYASVLTGRAIFYWLSRTGKSQWLPCGVLAVIFIWLSYSAFRGVNQELTATNTGFMFMIDEALHDPVLQHIPFPPEAVYYDTGSWGSLTWPFGGQGNLFKYLYNNPYIIEIAVVKGKVLESDKPLCTQAKGKKTLYFGFDVEHFSWHTIKARDYCAL
jgi:hypothetical protein